MDEIILNQNKNINRGFRKLEIWKYAIKTYKLVNDLLKKHSEISIKIKAQIFDSALSISSNIAEGYSRRTLKENLRFYEIALSSIAENYSQMFALYNANQICDNEFTTYDEHIYKLENKLIGMNKKLIEKLKSNDNWNTDYE